MAYINEYHQNMLRQWLKDERVRKDFMEHFPTKECPKEGLDMAHFKYVNYATGLDFNKEALGELYQFLKEEGYLYHDGKLMYSLV